LVFSFQALARCLRTRHGALEGRTWRSEAHGEERRVACAGARFFFLVVLGIAQSHCFLSCFGLLAFADLSWQRNWVAAYHKKYIASNRINPFFHVFFGLSAFGWFMHERRHGHHTQYNVH
jgi:hypothetical protein